MLDSCASKIKEGVTEVPLNMVIISGAIGVKPIVLSWEISNVIEHYKDQKDQKDSTIRPSILKRPSFKNNIMSF